MKKFSIITDTTLDLNFEEAKEAGIHLISNGLSVDGQTYQEYVDITTDQFNAIEAQAKTHPRTGAASPGQTFDVMEEALKEHPHALCLTMTSGYSGGINIRTMVAEELSEDADREVVIYNTPSIFSGGIPYYRQAVACRDQGYDIDQTIQVLNRMAAYTSSQYAGHPVYITEGGRFPQRLEDLNIQVGDGQMMMVEIERQGRYLSTAANSQLAIQTLVQAFDQAQDQARQHGLPLDVLVTYNEKNEDLENLIQAMSQAFPDLDLECRQMGPIASIHVGLGAFGLVWFPKIGSITVEELSS